MKTFRISVVFGLLACGSFSLPACSEDSEPAPATAGSAGVGGTAGPGGTGGSAGAAGTGGAAASGGTGGAPTTTCGGMTCTGFAPVPPLLPTGIQPCCAGPAGDKCGIDGAILGFACVETNQPGNPDDTCFAQDGGAGTGGSGGQGAADSGATDSGATDAGDSGGGRGGAVGAGGTGGGFGRLPGCCKPNGTCGLMINLPGVLQLGCVEFTANDSGPPQRCTPTGS